jgi:hypothetical protein
VRRPEAAQGHGIHLAANSVGNVEPSPVVHLWDEVVGPAVWYAGVAVVCAVLATAVRDRPLPDRRGWRHRGSLAALLAVGFGPAVLGLLGHAGMLLAGA